MSVGKNDMHPAMALAKRDLETFQHMLGEINAKRLSLGDAQGLQSIDRTSDYKELLERKISELKAELGDA